MVTRTLGPLHFEDLEPHRFEDLVRNLLYDFRDWHSIEPTGHGGSDDGYDARGWERVSLASTEAEDDAETGEEVNPAHLTRPWMIQCKREKQVGPADVRRIITETVTAEAPPYGYMLVAPVDFSKKARDIFREELRRLRVEEFYLWGKADIEDMLFMPKNDRILFAFMGVSLASKRRSRTTEVRASITTKNKLARILGDSDHRGNLHRSVLFRHINDDRYPYRESGAEKIEDAWQEHPVVQMHPLGLLVESRRHLAYIDQRRKEYDFLVGDDLVSRQSDRSDLTQEPEDVFERRRAFSEYHESLPLRHRGTFVHQGLVRYRDILAIDEKGDSWHDYPHVFVDMELGKGSVGGLGPFAGWLDFIELAGRSHYNNEIHLGKEWKRIHYFPPDPPVLPPYNVIEDRELALPEQRRHALSSGIVTYDCDSAYGPLAVRDVIRLTAGNVGRGEEAQPWVEVVEVIEMTASALMTTFGIGDISELEFELGGRVAKRAKVRAIEFRKIHDFQFRPRAVSGEA